MTESRPDQAGQQWPDAAAWPGQGAWPDTGQSAWPSSGQSEAVEPAPPGPGLSGQPPVPHQPAPGHDPRTAAYAFPGQPLPAGSGGTTTPVGLPANEAGRPASATPPGPGGPAQPAPQAPAQQPGYPGQPAPHAFPAQQHPQPGWEQQQQYPQGGWEQQQQYPQGGWEQHGAHEQQGGWEQQQQYPQGGWEQHGAHEQQGGWEQQQQYPQRGWDGGQGGYDPNSGFQGFDQGGGYEGDFSSAGWVSDELGDGMLPSVDHLHLKKPGRSSGGGWRRMISTVTGQSGSRDDLQYRTLVNRINQPIVGDYRIAILSLKGGVGKTTTTVGLGSTFASLRGDRVIAVDANPDLGTLGSRVPRQSNSTVRDLLVDTSIYRYSDVRAHTSQSSSRLEVLASERDPAISEAFSERDYRGVIKILQRFYNVILTDCGTGLMHSAMKGVLDLAHALVLVTSPALDGARSAGATLDWLLHHGYDQLVARTVVVVSSSRPGSPTLDLNQLRQHFLVRCRAVQVIPFDDHLSEGAEIELDHLHRSTRRSFVELAALIADDFPSAVSRGQRGQY